MSTASRLPTASAAPVHLLFSSWVIVSAHWRGRSTSSRRWRNDLPWCYLTTAARAAARSPHSAMKSQTWQGIVGGLLDHLEIHRAHVLGYSMGGAIAQEFVRQFPDRVFRSGTLRDDVRRPARNLRITIRCPGDAGARRAEAGRDRPAHMESYLFAGISREPPQTGGRSDAPRNRGAYTLCTLRICSIKPLRNSIVPGPFQILRLQLLC